MGLFALAAGALALAMAQPEDVCYPRLLVGALGTFLPLGLLS